MPVISPATKERTMKVHVDLTVPDLALGARLLLDDVVVNSNYKEIMDLVAKNFRRKGEKAFRIITLQ